MKALEVAFCLLLLLPQSNATVMNSGIVFAFMLQRASEQSLESSKARVSGGSDEAKAQKPAVCMSQQSCLQETAPYGWLRHESGVHRVQRVPSTDKKGRMQTSSAAVVILPVAEEEDVVFSASDLKIEISKKSSGPGGQSVNAAHQAVRAIHIPTGLSVQSTTSQSQHENRIRAVEMLRTKLLDKQLSARSEFERTERKDQRGTGDRSEKIRTYNFQRDEVVDHRLPKDEGGSGHSATDVVFAGGLFAILMSHRHHSRMSYLDRAVSAMEQQLLEKAS